MTDQSVEPSTAPVVEAPVAPDLRTLQGLMREARAAATTSHTVDIPIPGIKIDAPGFGPGELWGTFRALDDYREMRKIGKRHERVRDEATRELEIAADVLVRSSVTTFLRIDGYGDVPLDMPVGTELAIWIGACAPGADVRDAEAAFMVFPNTYQLAIAAQKITDLSDAAGQQADEELSKN
jgi:hypothetical protein